MVEKTMTAGSRRALAGAERFAAALRVAASTAWECFVKRLPLLLVTVALVPLATAAYGQADDKAYCAQLVELYRRYVQNSPGRSFDVEASRALDD